MTRLLQAMRILNDYNETELVMLSYDYFPDVYSVLYKYPTNEAKIVTIVDYCQEQQQWPSLLLSSKEGKTTQTKQTPTIREFKQELRKLTKGQLKDLCQDYETFEDLYDSLFGIPMLNDERIRQIIDFSKKRDKFTELHNALSEILDQNYTIS